MNNCPEKRESRITDDSQEKYHPNRKSEYRTRNGFYTFANIRNIHNMHISKELMDDKEDNLSLQAFQSNLTSNKSVSNTIVKIPREIKRIKVAVNKDDLSVDFHAAMLLAF